MQQRTPTFNTNNAEEIEVHVRTYRSLLKSTGKIKISQLIDSHLEMNSILHEKGGDKNIDIAAFIYALLRLPSCTSNVKNIILGQSYDVFKNHGFAEIERWQEVETPGRRRKMFYDRKDTLVVYIASVTDVDDIITLATCFQIEWNKLHKILSSVTSIKLQIDKIINNDELTLIKNIWGKDYLKFISIIKNHPIDFTVQLLAGSYTEYAKATQKWWENIATQLSKLHLVDKPIYFVSSNTHSITNLLTRFVVEEENLLVNYLYKSKNHTLIRLWKEIKSGDFLANKENFLYYLAKKYAKHNSSFLKKKKAKEKILGIHTIPASHYLDIDTQVIEVKKLVEARIDPRLEISTNHLKKSDAIIVNIDYPLGWAAYQVLIEIGQNVSNLRGIYIMGKAATLNGQIGDILLPTLVFDQHTKNIYAFNNAIKKSDFTELFKTGQILPNQKTISAKGTFLENASLIKQWYHGGYTIIEMESGPYLNAIYEFIYYNRYMENQFVNLTPAPFEIGIAHYASDTPYSKAKNLGVRNLSYEGVEPTYAISTIILKKIIDTETTLICSSIYPSNPLPI